MLCKAKATLRTALTANHVTGILKDAVTPTVPFGLTGKRRNFYSELCIHVIAGVQLKTEFL